MKRFLLLGVGLLVLLLGYAAWGLPSRAAVRALAKENPKRTSVMLQRAAEAQAAGRRVRHQQSWVPLSRISRHLILAVVASEDQKFFGHEGVDWEAIQKSLEEDRKKLALARGGSTITQQLAKNLFFTTHKNPLRKLQELLAASWLEEDLGKKRILELYLNVVEWGDGIWGCEAASRRYYGRSAAELDEVQAAGLAAMLPNPRRINPTVSPARHGRARKRVLWLMARAGFLKGDLAGLGTQPEPPAVEDADEPEPAAASPEPPASTAPASTPAEPAPSTPEPTPEPPASPE